MRPPARERVSGFDATTRMNGMPGLLDPAQWDRLRALLDEAERVEPAQRSAWAREAMRREPALAAWLGTLVPGDATRAHPSEGGRALSGSAPVLRASE